MDERGQNEASDLHQHYLLSLLNFQFNFLSF